MSTLVLLSGGLDSATLLYRAMKDDDDVNALAFDYGQRHRKELDYAAALCARTDTDLMVVGISAWGSYLRSSALIDANLALPAGEYTDESLAATVVPGRNAVFLAMAHSLAAARQLDTLLIGAHTGDHAVYKDCRPEFISAMRLALNRGSDWPVALDAPFAFRTKADIVLMGARLGVPWDLTWSCYEGGAYHCGVCSTCTERRQAFDTAGVFDPTIYEATA